MAYEASHWLEGKRVGALAALFGMWLGGVGLMTGVLFFTGVVVAVTSTLLSVPLFIPELVWIRKSRQSSRELKIGIFAVLFEIITFACAAEQLWPQASPLSVSASEGAENYLENQQIGDIKWHPLNYAELDVDIENPTTADYTNVTLTLHSELPIREMTQPNGASDCSFVPVEDLSRMAHIGGTVVPNMTMRWKGLDGKTYLMPLLGMTGPMPKHLIAANPDYRINCDRLRGGDKLAFLAAVVNPKDINNPRPPNWIAIGERHDSYGREYKSRIDFMCANSLCAPQGHWLLLSRWLSNISEALRRSMPELL